MTPPGKRPANVMVRSRRATTTVEFAICALVMVSIVVGFTEFGRLAWTLEVLQETAAEGVRCMGLRAASCASSGVYNAASTTTFITNRAKARGVVITASAVALNSTAVCGGATGFSRVAIGYNFATVAPLLLAPLLHGFSVNTSACFPNSA